MVRSVVFESMEFKEYVGKKDIYIMIRYWMAG